MPRTRSRLPLAFAAALALGAGAALAQGAGQADPRGHGGPASQASGGQAQPPAATAPGAAPQAPSAGGRMMMAPQQMQDMHRGMTQGSQMPMPRMAPGAERSPAEEVVREQEREIAQLRGFLARQR